MHSRVAQAPVVTWLFNLLQAEMAVMTVRRGNRNDRMRILPPRLIQLSCSIKEFD